MFFTNLSYTKKDIVGMYDTIMELLQNCEYCEEFKGKTPDEVFLKTADRDMDYITEDGEAYVAIAKYGNIYAIQTPKYLSGKQWRILEFMSINAQEEDCFICFSEEVLKKLHENWKPGGGYSLKVHLYI